MQVKGKRITVLGAARSGIAAAIMLKKKGADVLVSDSASIEKMKEQSLALQNAGVRFEFGGHSEKAYRADLCVLSPGIPVVSDTVQLFYSKNVPVYAEIETASWFNQSPIIGVTGSNGKTTTTTLIGEMLKKENPLAIVGGNIGQAFSDFVDQSAPDRWAVIELSSFQLETIDHFKADVTVVLNFAPNHLDRYASYKAYMDAKWRITKNLSALETLIFNGDDGPLSERALSIPAIKKSFRVGMENNDGAFLLEDKIYLSGSELITTGEIHLAGVHNYMNAMAAVLASECAGVSRENMRLVLKEFKGVEHRQEQVAEIEGVLYINDSKATTIESLSYALRSYHQPIVLITGGKDKGSDFTRLNELIRECVKEIVLIGTSTEKMLAAWKELKPMHPESSLQDAILKARSIAGNGDVVLFSPACASFDMFKDYEDRGRQFKNLVKGLM